MTQHMIEDPFSSEEFEKGLKLALPNEHIQTFGEPTFFLAGPIRGGGDWQVKAIEFLYSRTPNAYIFCPCRYAEDHPLRKRSVLERLEIIHNSVRRVSNFPNQTMWERRYMAEAARDGCLIFWLAAEDVASPREDGCYARDTRRELGEWMTRMELSLRPLSPISSPRVVFGIDEAFPGRKQIETNFSDQLPGCVISRTLEETLELAVVLAT